jgi:hypothetical protein
MDNIVALPQAVEKNKTLESVIKTHISNVEKGIFDPKDFSAGTFFV